MYNRKPFHILDYHRSMLADRERTLKMRDAITATVRPGDVVVDLGCGSGILSCFACRAGATRVYAIEVEPVIELARAVCKANGFDDRIVFVEGISTRVAIPEKADVVVSETIGNFGLEEGIVKWMTDARARFLKPGGRMIPEALELWVAPVEKATLAEQITEWHAASEAYHVDVSAGRVLAVNSLFSLQLAPEELLAPPVPLLQVELAMADPKTATGAASMRLTRSGTIHAIGGGFSARLIADLCLSTEPPNIAPSWSHVALPLDHPLVVQEGDIVHVEIHIYDGGSIWVWEVTHAPAAGPALRYPKQSTLAGQLLSKTSLKRQAQQSRPQLNGEGRIALAALQAFDGSRSLSELAAWLATAEPARFPGPDDALDFLRELTSRYS